MELSTLYKFGLLFVLTASICNLVSANEEIATDECGKSLTCYKQPDDCTNSSNCDMLVLWKEINDGASIEVTLASTSGYIGWAQNPEFNKMENAKGVVCYNNGTHVQLKSFHTTSNSGPTLKQLPNGYILNSTYINNQNSIICKFTRTATVPSGSENLMYEITNGLHQLYTHGIVQGGIIQYHKYGDANRFISKTKIDLTPTVQEVSTDECGKSLTCYKQPKSCTSSLDCHVLVQHKFDSDKKTIHVTLATNSSNGWVGWAQNNKFDKMVGAKGVVCVYNGSLVQLQSFKTDSNTRPTFIPLAKGYTLQSAHKTSKNSIVCQFTRPIAAPSGSENLMYDASEPLYMLHAHATYANNKLTYHFGDAWIDQQAVDLTPQGEVSIDDCGKSLTCYKQPKSCTSSVDCHILVQHKFDSDTKTIHVTLATNSSNGWVGWAQNNKFDKMVGAKGVVCVYNGSLVQLQSFKTDSNTRPTFIPLAKGYTLQSAHKTSKNSIVCQFTRPVAVPSGSENLMYDASEPLYMLHAHATYANNKLTYHFGDAWIDQQAVDLTPQGEVSTDECGKSLTCYKQPKSCTSSLDCHVLVQHKFDSDTKTIHVTLATNSSNGWIGWAQNNKFDKMVGAKGVVCVYNGSLVQLQSFKTDSNTRPTFIPMAKGYTLQSAHKTSKNSIVCQFTRPVAVPSGSENLMYDASEPLYMLHAHATYANNKLTYHYGDAWIDQQAVDLTPTKASQSRIAIPSDCKDDSNCDAVVEFQYDEPRQMMVFTLQTRHAWVASAQRPQAGGAKMINIKGQYCVKDGGFGSLDGSKLNGNGAPEFSSGAVVDVTLKSTKTENGVTTCIYERTIKPSQGNVYLHDLSNPLMMVVAFGKSGSGNRISRHGLGDYATTAAFDLLKASGEIITTTGRMLQDKEVAHGILMVIAWIICSTIGIFMARYMKQATKEKKITGKPAWFPLHQGLMMSCVVVFFIAFIVILVEKQGWAESAGTHGILGLIAIILGLIQPLMAMVRPAPDADRRFIFNWFHRSFGMIAWLLAGLSIIYAFYEHLQESYTEMLVFMIVVVVLFILLDIVLCASSKNSASADVAYSGTNNMVDVKHTSSNSNTSLPTIFCIIVVLLSVAMGIFHIYAIASHNDRAGAGHTH
ncbi:uncharacterized protein [Clytia hemisphaerica]|uniref:uncharacterized protein n=1 Tax=Clytia hemisphaerica TaxID=252671 RepID=UPI0034D5ABCA